jgi:hypothetical protein
MVFSSDAPRASPRARSRLGVRAEAEGTRRAELPGEPGGVISNEPNWRPTAGWANSIVVGQAQRLAPGGP